MIRVSRITAKQRAEYKIFLLFLEREQLIMAETIKKNMLTRAGLERYESELDELVNVKRKEVAEKIKIARELGDLSENAEYDAAKDEQRDIEARIAELTQLLKNAEVVSDDEISIDKVSVGCSVKLLDVEYDEVVEYKIVGSAEAKSLEGKISNECPVGAALMGRKMNEIIDVPTMAGVVQYKILDIQRFE